MTIVVDASAIVELLLRTRAAPEVERAIREHVPYAPSLIDVEVPSALARLERSGVLSPSAATRLTRSLALSPIVRVEPVGLIDEIWRRRSSLSIHDASYVALAHHLRCALLTGDRRLASAPGLGVTVTLIDVDRR